MPKNFAAWPRGWPRNLEYPDLPIHEILDQSATRIPDRTAMIFMNQQITYGQLKKLSDRFAAALAGMGVAKGDRVAIHLPNCPQFAIAYFGLLKAGAVFSPVSPMLSSKEVAFQLADSGARVLVSLDQIYPGIAQAGTEAGVKQSIIVSLGDALSPPAPPAQRPSPGNLAFNSLLLENEPKPPRVSIDPRNDLAHIAYTGGTTGRSKGVMLNHCNIMANVMQGSLWCLGARVETVEGQMKLEYEKGPATAAQRIIQRDQEVALMVPPWFHAMGVVSLNNQIFLGSTVIVFPRFDPEQFLTAAVKCSATLMNGAPPVYRQIFNHPAFKGNELQHIKWAVSGAAPLPVSLIERMLEHIPGVITEGYGLSECSAAATVNPPNREGMRPGSIGLPLFDTELKVVDLASGKTLPPGEEGEICIKGPQMMQGYWQNPQATANVLRDGWLHTGDIGREDQRGYFYITDRLKDMILYKGYNVYPRDLEEVLHRHGSVELCAVLGRPDADSGERVVAFVQPRAGHKPDAEELMEFVNGQVAHYKKIKELFLVERIPVSHAGKVLKRVLRDELAD